jgi:hypothetical protein
MIRRFNSDGTRDTNFSLVLNGYVHAAITQPDGILIAGSFTEVNCVRRTYLARLIPSDTPDSFALYSTAAKTRARTHDDTIAPGEDGLLLAHELSRIHAASHATLAAETSGKGKVGHGYEHASRE